MLSVEGVTRRFGGLEALSGVSLEAGNGEVLGLIGPNGSGKTTLFNVVSGLYQPDEGRVVLDGTELNGLSPDRIATHGMARTFQTPRIYMRMTLRENLEAAYYAVRRGGPDPSVSGRCGIAGMLETVGLAARAGELAKNLPLPDQRRLELIRTLVGDPKIVLLDEPAGGMTPAETAEVANLIRDVIAPGRTCIVIEHKMDMVMSLCARVVVLNFGHVIADGAAVDVLGAPDVMEAYLGRSAAV